MSKKINVEQWRAIRRKEEASKIDPATAYIGGMKCRDFEPLGDLDPHVPEELRGWEYFARAPGNDAWVWFGNLPDNVRDALWKRYKAEQAFHAGLKAHTMNDDFSAVMQFRADELEWLGLMEKIGGERPEYRFTEFGNKFICAHPRPGDLWEALERLRHVREQEDIKQGVYFARSPRCDALVILKAKLAFTAGSPEAAEAGSPEAKERLKRAN